MASQAPTSPLRQILEGQLTQLSTEVERLFEEARGRARRELADQLNQSVRRLRQSASLDELAATLLDAASPFATGAALFRISGANAHGDKLRGLPDETATAFAALQIPLAEAAALAGAVETRDPVTAITTAAELSPQLVALFALPKDDRAYIYPLVLHEDVPVLLYCWGTVQGAALEMLTQVAAAVWSSLVVPEPIPLVAIAPALAPAIAPVLAPAPAQPPPTAWEALSAADQAIHLRAQRFARVHVAEMRLLEAAAVQSGRTQRNLYDALRARIDEARTTFRQSFFVPCPSMVDYLHVELVRTLAHDDADLLGKDYPGPLV